MSTFLTAEQNDKLAASFANCTTDFLVLGLKIIKAAADGDVEGSDRLRRFAASGWRQYEAQQYGYERGPVGPISWESVERNLPRHNMVA